MATPVKRVATYEDVLRAPENKVAEILDGDLYTSPRPAPPHAIAVSALGAELGPPFHFGRGGPGGWWILYEPELHVGDEIAVPDLAGWRRTRMVAPPPEAYFTLVPDWICEAVSPSTEHIDRRLKLPLYARCGVAHAWLVNPLTRTLEVLRLQDRGWLLVATHGADQVVRAEPFEVLELDLLHLWGETR